MDKPRLGVVESPNVKPIMPTITPAEFAKLNEVRRLQVERYRTAHFKREGSLPSDSDAAIDPQWLRVKLGEIDRCIPVKTLTAWARTFGDSQALSFELNGVVTVKRGTSRLRLFTASVMYDDKGAGFREGATPIAPLDSPVTLTEGPDGSLAVSVPDIAAELSTLRAETTANRKQLAKERAITKARKAE